MYSCSNSKHVDILTPGPTIQKYRLNLVLCMLFQISIQMGLGFRVPKHHTYRFKPTVAQNWLELRPLSIL